MENKEYTRIIGNDKAPYMNQLANEYTLARQFYAITKPSLPNYFAVTGGSTFGITSNCTNCHLDETHIVDQLEKKDLTWKAYIEGFPSTCFTGGSSGRYAKKHNPWVYYDNIVSNPERCSKIVDLPQLSKDIASGNLPNYIWITPDLCNDTHDCPIAVGDEFLAKTLPPLLGALGPRGVLFVTYDEGDSRNGCCGVATGGRIYTVLAGPAAKRNFATDTEYTLYSILRTLEDAWGLGHLGQADCQCTTSMADLITSP
jgi:hypothetical protein